jgi:hypothetical protein
MDQGRPERPDEFLAPAAACDDGRFTAAGFRLEVISEPQPDPAARALFPADFAIFSTQPRFLFFVLRAS